MADNTTVTLELLDGLRFSAASPSGKKITLDSSSDFGGVNAGPTPMELMLMALGGCTGIAVISLLRTMCQDVTGYQVRVEGDRADQHPKVYTKIRVEHIVVGNSLNPERVHLAVEKAARKYCPASATLEALAQIDEFVCIIDESTDEEIAGPVQLSEPW